MQAIEKKKAEHDELLALSEKDLWCRDLDDFLLEWENQLAVDAEIKTNIRRLGRRVSKKIGAGTARGRKAKDDDDFVPDKKARGRPKAAAAKPAVKTETKSAQRFAEMFSSKPKVKKEPAANAANVMELSDAFSDDDYAALSRSKTSAPAIKTSQSPPTEAPDTGRVKRAAAAKVKAVIDDDSESDDDQMLGDVGALVKGIDKPAGERERGRFSLHAMSRPDSSQGNASTSGLSKTKPKSAKAFDFDDDSPDDTNYELLAKSSPHKTATKEDHIDSFLSDDEPFVAPAKPAATKSKPTSTDSEEPAPAGLATIKKVRGRPAAAKSKEPAKAKAAPKATTKTTKTAAKVASRPATKQTTLSPAAKAYAAKKAVKKSVIDDDSDEEMAEPDSPPPKAASRARPGRAAASRRPIVVDDDSSAVQPDEDESDDPFEMDDDED
jgi:DNA topoisomerase-2